MFFSENRVPQLAFFGTKIYKSSIVLRGLFRFFSVNRVPQLAYFGTKIYRSSTKGFKY